RLSGSRVARPNKLPHMACRAGHGWADPARHREFTYHPIPRSTFGRRASSWSTCGQNVIIEPNKRRRTRIFRAFAGAVVIVMVGAMVASGLTLPAISLAPRATPTTAPTPSAATAVASESPGPTFVDPSPDSSPTIAPAPTADAHGCFPPPAGTV